MAPLGTKELWTSVTPFAKVYFIFIDYTIQPKKHYKKRGDMLKYNCGVIFTGTHPKILKIN